MIIEVLKNIGNRLKDSKSNRRYKKEIKKYDKAICRDPNNPGLYSCRGNVYESLGKYPKALENYNEAIKLDTDTIFYNTFYNERANLFIKMGDPVSALLDYSQLFTIELPFSEIPCSELFENTRNIIKAMESNPDIRIDPAVYEQILANISKVSAPLFKPFEWAESMLRHRLSQLYDSVMELEKIKKEDRSAKF
jgi:tetratricopeptide (TPR) repeat protein